MRVSFPTPISTCLLVGEMEKSQAELSLTGDTENLEMQAFLGHVSCDMVYVFVYVGARRFVHV